MPERTANPRPESYVVTISDLTVAAGAAPAVLELGRITVAQTGQMMQLCCWVGGSDFVVPTDCSHTILEQAFRTAVTGGSIQLGAITANRVDKQTVGGAGTFSADVNFIAVAGLAVGGTAPLNLHAQNVAGTDRRGRIVVHYWFAIGAF